MDAQPPPVTIVDPNAPAGTADLLDSGRDPWRPSRRQVVVSAFAVLLLGVVGGGLAALRHVRHEQALDRQSVHEVRLVLGVDEPDVGLFPDSPAGSVQLNLSNDGPAMIRVRTVQLDDGDEVPVTTGSDVLPGAATSVTLTLRNRCTTDAGRATHTVTVRLRTSRGQVATRVQRLTSDELLNTHVREQCGTLKPTEALAPSIVSARTRGAWVDVVLDLRNTSVLPLSVRSLGVPVGLRAELPPLPIVLPPADAPGTTGPSRQVRVRLRVQDCDVFNAGLSGENGLATLRVRLHGPLEEEVGHVFLSPQHEPGFGEDAPSPQLQLMMYCPALFFG
ncbi:MAG TPA: hypothetical protein VM097_12835 [Mycobacteriales bacterium]|nr:hypothetical protein [Mycobacteriales bacterium]